MSDKDLQSERILHREEERIMRNKAKAEAYQENMIKTFANLLKQENVKKSLAREAKDATRSREQNPFFKQASYGTYRDDGEVITGLEPRPWEED